MDYVPDREHNMKITDSKSLGNAIRSARRSLDVTQDQLALTSGTNRRFIIELEQGKPTAQIGKVLQVLRTLGVSLALTPPPVPAAKERADGTTA
jgi:HTH-type transcriptional regulator / antitoxin HipB